MGTYEELKQAISAVIRENNNQEITGAILQNALLSIINMVGSNATFAGIANTRTAPSQADANVFYIATEPGTYPNFGGITIRDEVAILKNGSGRWEVETFGAATKSSVDNLSTAISNEITRAKNAEQTLTNNLNKEKTDRADAITNINNTTNQNVFCTTKEGNEIFKEVYIYPYVSIRNVSKIVIEKGVITESGAKKYQITFTDSNGAYSYVYLGNKDTVVNGEVISGAIQGAGFGSGATIYAVIDWNKILDGSSKTITTNFTSLILNSKYSPIITHVMQSYKSVKGSLGNAFIRELYLENLSRIDTKEDGTSQTHYYLFTPAQIKDTFILSTIKRNVDSTWTINFGAIGTNGSFYPFKYETKENPENSDVIKADILCWIGDGSVQYKATMYAVVDWTQIPNGTSVNYGRPLLGGVVQKRLSPIIYNYIEINKLRTELNLRPINEE